MRAELGLPSVRGDDDKGGGMMGGFGGSMGGVGAGKAKRPINVKFEIPYFTTSGIQVRYLKIIEPKVCAHSLVGMEETATNDRLAAIPVSAMGTLYHAVWRYSRATTRRKLDRSAATWRRIYQCNHDDYDHCTFIVRHSSVSQSGTRSGCCYQESKAMSGP